MTAIDLTTTRRNQSDTEWDAKRDARQNELDRRRALYLATIAPPTITVPKPPQSVEPCPLCGKLTRPLRTTVQDYPGTLSRQGRGVCGACKSRAARERATTRGSA